VGARGAATLRDAWLGPLEFEYGGGLPYLLSQGVNGSFENYIKEWVPTCLGSGSITGASVIVNPAAWQDHGAEVKCRVLPL
jgi:hypothetical protein